MAERVTSSEAFKKCDAQLKCSLCLDYFKQPKLLPCFHTFCKSPCLDKLVTKDGRSLTCPTCKHVIPLSERGVAGLQSDIHIDHLFEIRDPFKKAEDDGDTNCDSCGEGKAKGGENFSSDNSKTTGYGLKNAKLKETTTVYFEPMTRNNKKFKGQLNVRAELEHTKSETKLKCDVIVEQNGRHEISYRPVYRGKHELHISVNEVPVRGSPFPITVTGLPEKPIRVVQGLNKPRGVVVNSKNQFVVVDNDGASISVLTTEGEKIRSFGQLNNAFGVTVDQDDNIYVAENSCHQIRKYSSEGALLETAGSYGNGNVEFKSLVGICANHSDNNLYVVDPSYRRIQVLTTNLKFVRYFGTQGSENGQFKKPMYAAVDSANNLYVTDRNNHRVQVFTADGQFLRAFSQKADNKKLSSPWAITIDSSDTVYVSEDGPHCVSMFTSQGEYITTIGGQGSEEGQFNVIYGLCIDLNDSVIVSEQNNHRLQVF